MPDMTERIKKILDKIRPYLQIDGGDIEFVSYNEERKVVEVRLLGACTTCAMSYMTLRAGIEGAILKELPEIKRIEAVRGNE
ncbi:MAG TPA: NifU family protein [Candidatus Kapabacteria bacterium]|nr:NifU family protein [Candidatus Kapabacteria bacterium]